jgi:hypothetical protein
VTSRSDKILRHGEFQTTVQGSPGGATTYE